MAHKITGSVMHGGKTLVAGDEKELEALKLDKEALDRLVAVGALDAETETEGGEDVRGNSAESANAAGIVEVGELEGFLAGITDVSAIKEMSEADARPGTEKMYKARLAQLKAK